MSNLSNMPWEDRPVGSKEVVWRYSANPIIPRDLLPTSNSIFNSAVVPFGDSYAGVLLGVMVTKASLPSVWHGPRTSRLSISWRMLSFRSIATE